MFAIREEAVEAGEQWINGTLTEERSFRIQEDLQTISDKEKVSPDSNYWEYLRIAEVIDLWCDLIRNGLVTDMTPYSRYKVLYLTLKLVEGHGVSVELASKMIEHAYSDHSISTES